MAGRWIVLVLSRVLGGEEALRDLVDAARNKEMKIIADLVLKHACR